MLFKKSLLAVATLAFGGYAMTAGAASPATATFNVTMKITSACTVKTPVTQIDLGTAVASSTAISNTGSTTVSVNCSNETPFYVGLAPSAANGGTNLGTGKMSGTAGNTDLVPYTLYSDSGYSVVWGNTATSTSVGNGKSGTGAGMASGNKVDFIVYAKAVNSDFAPDTYTDTVTVNVNY